MNSLGLYVVCLGIPLVIGLWTQHRVKSTFQQWSEVPEDTGMTGAEVARRILDANGLQSVPVQGVAGALTDHYDPRTRSVNLSEPVYAAATISSTAVAAHEVGHAIQHAKAYVPMTVRSALWPVTSFASSTWTILLLIGAIMGALNLVLAAIVLYAAVVLFQIVTLPVEFDASRRAAVQLKTLGIANADESVGVHKVLTSAALTYVAGALAALSQLVFFALTFLGGRN
ncbi:MAG TPA: zinc metallopeptidase [Solirubrobacteraceae bacterium]|nr:zinc metallopeptidase [Solirubrobacteraceae bacterium]